MILRSVDFPAPFGPTTPILAPGRNASVTSSRTTLSPCALRTLRNWKTYCAMPPAYGGPARGALTRGAPGRDPPGRGGPYPPAVAPLSAAEARARIPDRGLPPPSLTEVAPGV